MREKEFKKMKKIIAICWSLGACLVLWLLNLSQAKGLPQKPTLIDIFNSYSIFTFMIIGGSACYHFATEIISSKYSETCSQNWNKLKKHMKMFMFIMLSVPIVIIILRDYITMPYSFILSMLYMILAIIVAVFIGSKIESEFKAIREIDENHP